MKNFLNITVSIWLLCLSSVATAGETPTLVYHQNMQGETLFGSISGLQAAIREGKRVRLYMKLKTVEHAMDSGFLSIFEGHVYAQINTIQGQRPNRNTKEIELRPYSKHVGLYSTKSPYEIKWYVY